MADFKNLTVVFRYDPDMCSESEMKEAISGAFRFRGARNLSDETRNLLIKADSATDSITTIPSKGL